MKGNFKANAAAGSWRFEASRPAAVVTEHPHCQGHRNRYKAFTEYLAEQNIQNMQLTCSGTTP
jgi:hypothetical protein